MRQRRPKLDRHGAELLALRRAGANIAQLTRWLLFQHDTAVAATTVRRWLGNARRIGDIDLADDFDAAALGELRARDRELRFPRLAVSTIARPLPAGLRRFCTFAHSSTATMRPATMRAVACLPASARGRSARFTSLVATAPTGQSAPAATGVARTASASCASDFSSPYIINSSTMLTGSAATMDAVCSACRPPASNSTAATSP